MDSFLFQKINQFAFQSFYLDAAAIFFAKYFEYILIFCLFLFLIKSFKRYWPMLFQAFFAAVFARLVVVEIIRYLFPRPRPFVDLEVNLLFEHSFTNAFPSGHAAFYFALSTVIFLFLKKNYPRPKFWQGIVFLFFLASFLIAFSRVFAGIHWPSDILAGILVGIACGWATMSFYEKAFLNTWKQKQ